MADITREIIRTEEAPQAIGPYSQAVRVGDFLYTAGQIGLDPATGDFPGDDVVAQTEQVLKNLRSVLKAGGSDLDRVVKTTIFVTNIDDFSDVNDVYSRYFMEGMPARSTVQVAGLPRGAQIEIEAVALVDRQK